jgi:hypothetical protein
MNVEALPRPNHVGRTTTQLTQALVLGCTPERLLPSPINRRRGSDV